MLEAKGSEMSNRKKLFDELVGLTTEKRNCSTVNIDSASPTDVLRMINSEDKKVAFAVERELPYVAQAAEIVTDSLVRGGRLFYVGAGTSGRIGVQDAVECPPTFGTDPTLIQGLIAGGRPAMFKAQEGAEDIEENGANDVVAHGIGAGDVVCGIAASRRTPYVVGAIRKARELGAKTVFVTTNPRADFDLAVDVAICPEVGPEVLTGSTRMKSGTAQKMVLNMITTAVMISLGKVYENMMVDLQMTNKKLEERAKRIVMTITGVGYDKAAEILKLAGGHVKTAVVMLKADVSAETAKKRLKKADGFVRRAIGGNFGKH